MAEPENKLLVCNCEDTMPLDGRALARACGRTVRIHKQLCRAEIDRFAAAAEGGAPVLVCCTQEAPLFDETLAERGVETPVAYLNIRETAGWSDEAAQATPKIAALIAAAAIDTPPTRTTTMASEGRTLVYGGGDVALAAAAQLAARLDVTVILAPPAEAIPPAVTDFAVFAGRIVAAAGHLGAFAVTVDGYAPLRPSSRAALGFAAAKNGVRLDFDIIVDLSGGAPLIAAGETRDGYLRPDPGSPAAVQKALFAATDLVGTFDKPIYVSFTETLCAHARNRVAGCVRCIDSCAASAITPAGDHVFIDPHLCAGCGSCASVCPTGAASYAAPPAEVVLLRLRALLRAYRDAGGRNPAVLLHDPRHGAEMIGIASRLARGLPARVLPLAVNEITQIGFEILVSAFAYGAERVLVLAGPGQRDRLDALRAEIAYVEAALDGLGYGAGRLAVLDDDDPEAFSDGLYALASLPEIPAGGFLPMGGRRSLVGMALHHLYDKAPAPKQVVPLPAGAPFGTVHVDVEGCTLCLACIGVCPTGALADDPDTPMLRFTEQACIQCALCRNTCPESVITLETRFNFAAAARQPAVIKEEAPFACISCGKPFGTRSSIERTIARLTTHPMFAGDAAALERLRMCETCRVTAQFADDQPMAGGARPRIRTTDDYLAGRIGDEDDEE